MTKGIYDTGFIVRLPVHVASKVAKMNRFVDAETQKKQATVVPGEIADQLQELLGLSPDVIDALLNHLDSGRSRPLSLETVVEGDETMDLLNFIENPDAIKEFQAIEEQVSREAFIPNDWLEKQSPAKKAIAHKRVFAQRRLTLQELAEELGITKQRVQQMEAALLREIRYQVVRQQRLEAHIDSSTTVSREVKPKPNDKTKYPQPEIVQPIKPVEERQRDYFKLNQVLVEKAVEHPVWETVPPEIKTVLNLTFRQGEETTTPEERAAIQNQLAHVLGISDIQLRHDMRHWLDQFRDIL